MKIPFDFSVPVGDRYYMTERSFLIIFDNTIFELGANSLTEVSDYLRESHPEHIEMPFAIIEITNAKHKVTLDQSYTTELVKNIRLLFKVTNLNCRLFL